MHHGLSARFAWPVGKEGRMLTYRGIIGKREIGEKTGNGWENGKPVEGVFVCSLSVLLQGACPPHPPATGVRSAPLRFAAWSPHVRRMFAACSPHGRRMFTAWSPQGRHIDNRVQCIISVLYVTLLVQREREKERKRET